MATLVQTEATRAYGRKYQREKQKDAQDIGNLPDVVSLERKAAAFGSLQIFCDYFPDRFPLPFSPDHLTFISVLQRAIESDEGGLLPVKMSRGFGKTTISEVGCMWAAMTGRREFCFLIGATLELSLDMLLSVRTELETNDLLLEDWPEVCFPIRCLEGEARQCRGQRYKGEQTHSAIRQKLLILPTIPGSLGSGAIICATGLTGAVRGKKHKRREGPVVRPSFVLLDDPQTAASAQSVSQTTKRERIIKRDVHGLAGHGKKITIVMPCTAICADDLTCRIFDKQKNPQWSSGCQFPMLPKFPTNMKLWEEYGEIRDQEFRNGGTGKQATEFYRARQSEMDTGAVVAWQEKYDKDELSPIQHALNLFLQDRPAFYAERQGTPQEEQQGSDQLDANSILSRTNGLDRRRAPFNATRLTAFVDVQHKALYYLVAAWADDFTSAIIDYGTYPDQERRYFTLNQVQRTLSSKTPGGGIEAAIRAGLSACADLILNREYPRMDGTPMRVQRLLIDSGAQPDTVFEWCRATQHAAIVMPSRGRYIGAASRPFHEYRRDQAKKLGYHWWIPLPERGRVDAMNIDTNFYKSFVKERLMTAVGDKTAMTLWGRTGEDHRMLADHFTSEQFVLPKTPTGIDVPTWKAIPGRDNHFWDCLVGCAAAASFQGATLPSLVVPAKPKSTVDSRADYLAKKAEFEARRGF